MAQSSAPEEAEDEASKDALYARATELRVKGRRKMSRAELEAAVAAAEAELAAAEKPPGAELGADEEANAEEAAALAEAALAGKPPKQATPEQAQKIFAATTEQLEGLTSDPGLAPHLKNLVVQELGKRTTKAREEKMREQARGAMERWKVTSSGGRYITRDGFPTELAAGSVITPMTHDLEHVRKQGFKLVAIHSLGVSLDELGNQVSEAG
jgi:hypothetical protein